jgi:hypothetical protein
VRPLVRPAAWAGGDDYSNRFPKNEAQHVAEEDRQSAINAANSAEWGTFNSIPRVMMAKTPSPEGLEPVLTHAVRLRRP